jgi:hypothetical protein
MFRGKPKEDGDDEKDQTGKSSLFGALAGGFKGIFKRLLPILKGGFGPIIKGLMVAMGPVIGLFGKLAMALGPVLGVIGAAMAGFKIGSWLNKKLGLSDKLVSGVETVQGWFGSSTDDKIKQGEEKQELEYYNKAKAEGRPISTVLANKLKARGVDVDPKLISAPVTNAGSKTTRVAAQINTLKAVEDKKEEKKEKKEDAKHAQLVEATKQVKVVTTPVTSNSNSTNVTLGVRNPDSTLQTFLQSRMRYA